VLTPYTHSSAHQVRKSTRGFTLIELLIALAVGMLILTASFTLVLSNKAVYNLDSARTKVNQNLRAGLDIISADIRQAGERLGGDFPAVEVILGVGLDSDTLVLRRNLIDDVLPVCSNVVGGSTKIWVAQQPAPALPSVNIDCLNSSTGLTNFRAQRLSSGGAIRAYIYDPVNFTGEFVRYTNDDASVGGVSKSMDVQPESGVWQNTYLASNQPRMYIIEERRFFTDTAKKDIVMKITGGPGTGEPLDQPMVTNIEDFQVSAYIVASPTPSLSGGTGALSGGNWKKLAFVRLEVKGKSMQDSSRTLTRTLTDDALPRNVLSR